MHVILNLKHVKLQAHELSFLNFQKMFLQISSIQKITETFVPRSTNRTQFVLDANQS